MRIDSALIVRVRCAYGWEPWVTQERRGQKSILAGFLPKAMERQENVQRWQESTVGNTLNKISVPRLAQLWITRMAAPKLEKGKQNGMDQPAITKSANEENNESYNHQLAARSTQDKVENQQSNGWITLLSILSKPQRIASLRWTKITSPMSESTRRRNSNLFFLLSSTIERVRRMSSVLKWHDKRSRTSPR